MSALLGLCLQKMGFIEEAYNLTNTALLHYNPRLFSDDSTLTLRKHFSAEHYSTYNFFSVIRIQSWSAQELGKGGD